jgi:V/A-type H+-transporting ATPase subunit E
MAVEDILKKIEADAEEEALAILGRAHSEAEAIATEARKRADAQRKKLESASKQRADEERNRIVTLARLEARREVLTEKQRLIDRVFEETRARVLKMARDDYQRLMETFMMSVAEPGECEVIVDPDESRIDQAFLDRVSAAVSGCSLRLSDERRAMGGGFVLKSGRVETNCTLDTILGDARERLETDVAEALFGDEQKDQ